MPSVECVDLVKVQGYFVKLTFTKFRGSFVKLSSTNCGLNSLKFEGFFFAKFMPELFLAVG